MFSYCRESQDKTRVVFQAETQAKMLSIELTPRDLVDRKVGYSREEELPKSYVQTLIRQNAYLIWRSIWKEGASIMVCGKGEMADAAKVSLLKVFGLFMDDDSVNWVDKQGGDSIEETREESSLETCGEG